MYGGEVPTSVAQDVGTTTVHEDGLRGCGRPGGDAWTGYGLPVNAEEKTQSSMNSIDTDPSTIAATENGRS